jgi:hypothetical protein
MNVPNRLQLFPPGAPGTFTKNKNSSAGILCAKKMGRGTQGQLLFSRKITGYLREYLLHQTNCKVPKVSRRKLRAGEEGGLFRFVNRAKRNRRNLTARFLTHCRITSPSWIRGELLERSTKLGKTSQFKMACPILHAFQSGQTTWKLADGQ